MAMFEDVDSMAWSQTARKQHLKHPVCTQFHPVHQLPGVRHLVA